MRKLELHEIITSSRLAPNERRAVERVYNFLKKSPSTIARVSRLAHKNELYAAFPHHANYVDYAICVLEKNGIIELDSLGFYSVK